MERRLTFVTSRERARMKGLGILRSALEELGDSFNDLSVRVIGADSAPVEPWMDQSLVDERFEFMGRVPRADLRKHYLQSDALVLASFTEAGPNVMYEALACGVPVIATNGDVFRNHSIGNNTLFFDRGDSSSLARQIERFYDEPERYWEAAFRTSSQYDIERTFDALLEEYRSLLE
ncbi:glycosyltransferase family 4 protein [Natronomonas halophila]|uniref:glycosyltransferase family 4 protein n=1 Tax=Natronomonas halophila TaxID=2747817 RepID=UPI0015B5E15C|nr:glycosyltransferase family 4 protein [Natronomonas halophila]QLD86842.1 glycosyltransferase family 4 protein [Natronomonas halophila]